MPAHPGRAIFQAIEKRIRLQGLIVSDHVDLIPEFDRKMSAWIKERKIALRETIVDDLETATDAFIGIFKGANTGKMFVRL